MTRDELLNECTIEWYRGGDIHVTVTHVPSGLSERGEGKSFTRTRDACLDRLIKRLSDSAKEIL